jgi:hypothetical protein
MIHRKSSNKMNSTKGSTLNRKSSTKMKSTKIGSTKKKQSWNSEAHPFEWQFEWSSTDVGIEIWRRVFTDCVRRIVEVGTSTDPLEDDEGDRTLSNRWLDGGETNGEGERRIERVGEWLLVSISSTFMSSFYMRRSRKRKNTLQLDCLFFGFGLGMCKSCL